MTATTRAIKCSSIAQLAQKGNCPCCKSSWKGLYKVVIQINDVFYTGSSETLVGGWWWYTWTGLHPIKEPLKMSGLTEGAARGVGE
jgi:hypothetical protein